jgi:hypothetical protein
VTNAVVAARGRSLDRSAAAAVAAADRAARIRAATAEVLEAQQARRVLNAAATPARTARAARKAAERATLAVGRLRAEGLTFAQIAALVGLSLPDTKQQVKRAAELAAGDSPAPAGVRASGGRAGE